MSLSLLDAYLQSLGKTVTWRSRGADGDDGEPTYTNTTIVVIWIDESKKIWNSREDDPQQQAYIQTSSAVEKDDIIIRDGFSYPVISTHDPPCFDGEPLRIVSLGQKMI